MKRVYLLAGLLPGAALTSRAQQAVPTPTRQHQLSVGTFGLAPNLGGQYHYRLGPGVTLGAEASYYFAVDYPGVQVGAVGRAYFAGHAPTGLYAQFKLGVGIHRQQVASSWGGPPATSYFGSYGATLGLGYQARLGPRWLVQAGAGFKAYTAPATAEDAGPEGRWEEVGQPGSPLDAQLSVGYRL